MGMHGRPPAALSAPAGPPPPHAAPRGMLARCPPALVSLEPAPHAAHRGNKQGKTCDGHCGLKAVVLRVE